MNLQEALEYIHGIPRFSEKPGLLRIRALAERLGDPQRQLRFVHIAGTNGKGSVAALTESVLRASGCRTGLFTSPYLEDFRERIRVNGEMIPEEALCRLTERTRAAVEDMLEEGLPHPNEFEVVTAMAFCWFLEQECDPVVLEVGLGGRFDATNVIDESLVSVVTNLSVDHVAQLGRDLAGIAREKAGIFKWGGRAVVSPCQPPEAMAALELAAKEKKVALHPAEKVELDCITMDANGIALEYQGLALQLPLLGEHQLANARTALQVLELMKEQGCAVTDDSLKQGFAAVCWPGRLELLRREPPVLLDAAHNPGGVVALCAALDRCFPDRPLVTVMGMLRDKDTEVCIPELAKRSRRFLAVAPPDPRRALAAEDCAALAGQFCPAEALPGLEQALDAALAAQAPEELLLICGSIPLVGAARTYLRQRQDWFK